MRFKRAIVSSMLPQVTDAVFSDMEYRILAVGKGELVQDLSNSSIKKVVSVLYELNTFDVSDNQFLFEIQGFRHFAFSDNNKNTLAAFWNDILVAEHNNNCISKVVQIADFLMNEALSSSSSFGPNYGKSIFMHCIYINEKIQFLPSDSIFWGETGYDAGQVLYELLFKAKNIDDLKENIFAIADIYSIKPKTLLNWTLMLLHRNYIQFHVMKLQKEKEAAKYAIFRLFDLYLEI